MNVIATTVVIAVVTGVLSFLIVLADWDLAVVRAFQGIGRPYARPGAAYEPMEAAPRPWVTPEECLPLAPVPQPVEMSEGERWLAEMANYSRSLARPYGWSAGTGGEPPDLREAS